jgi:hypothetical protein
MSKMSLDETVRWIYAGGETMCEQIGETRGKTRDEMSNEACKRKIKVIPKPTSDIHGK